MAKDYYALLDIPRGSDEKEIRSAYRRLARKWHPDVNPNDKGAEEKFKAISEAHEVLSDPEKRKLYDTYGSNWENAQNFTGGVPGAGAGGFRFEHAGGGIGSIFEQFFGGAGGGVPGYGEPEIAQPRDVEQTIELSLEEIDKGTTRTLTFQTMDAQRTREGIATVPKTKSVSVKIPAGIQHGKKLRVPGKGAAGANGRAGDLFVVVNWASHGNMKPVADHLEVEVGIPYTTAALGGEIQVPTLRGSVTMRVPEGAQSGQVFRLAGQGLTKMSGGRGDLMAKLKILVPKQVGPEERQLLTRLAEIASVQA